MAKTKAIIVSDLHVDTWEEAGDLHGKTRAEHFFDFLEAKKDDLAFLYIAGDLLDLPPDRGGDAFPAGGVAAEVLKRLLALGREPGTHVVYLVGNHDIGASGLRINQDFGITWLSRVAVCYPRICIPTPKGGILLEHGHFYDPSLAIYAKDLLWDTYFGGVREQPFVHIAYGLMRSLQRRDPVTGEHIWKPGELKPAPRPPEGCLQSLIKPFLRRPPVVVEDVYKPIHWRDKAKEVLDEYNKKEARDHRARVVVFGHTHRPDAKTWETGEQYFNSGDWSGDTEHSTYLEIDDEGNVIQHDWIKERD